MFTRIIPLASPTNVPILLSCAPLCSKLSTSERFSTPALQSTPGLHEKVVMLRILGSCALLATVRMDTSQRGYSCGGFLCCGAWWIQYDLKQFASGDLEGDGNCGHRDCTFTACAYSLCLSALVELTNHGELLLGSDLLSHFRLGLAPLRLLIYLYCITRHGWRNTCVAIPRPTARR